MHWIKINWNSLSLLQVHFYFHLLNRGAERHHFERRPESGEAYHSCHVHETERHENGKKHLRNLSSYRTTQNSVLVFNLFFFLYRTWSVRCRRCWTWWIRWCSSSSPPNWPNGSGVSRCPASEAWPTSVWTSCRTGEPSVWAELHRC